MNASDLIFSQNDENFTSDGYNINSTLLQSNCPALFTYVGGGKRTITMPASFVLLREKSQDIVANQTNKGIIPNKMYDMILHKSSVHSETPTGRAQKQTKTQTKKQQTKKQQTKKRRTKKQTTKSRRKNI
jgi:hypothetical protein